MIFFQMKILYPYNEILPHQKAHDRFVFSSCASLASQGASVTLLCGRGSQKIEELHNHYHTEPHPNLKVKLLPIIRKNNFIRLSYNRPFFFFCQQVIQKEGTDLVITSVTKQAHYHMRRKVGGVKYLYEVHELSYYPGDPLTPAFFREREMLASADHITVTTEALRSILRSAPYQLPTPISVVPLATTIERLSPASSNKELHLFYVGALYQGQGIDLLLEALSRTKGVQLSIVGGTKCEIAYYSKKRALLGLQERVRFLGFQPPSKLAEIVAPADAFVAAYSSKGRMPYVAHTKLDEYAAWGRPILAPDLPVVREHVKVTTLFKADDALSLQKAIEKLQDHCFLEKEQQKAREHHPFTWDERARLYLEIIKTLS